MTSERDEHVIRIIVTNLIYCALAITIASLALEADRLWPFKLPRQLELVAWPLLILGTVLILVAEYSIITESHATGAFGNPPGKLVTTGIYSWVRNPIYIGAAMLLFGIAFFRNSPTMLIIAFIFLISIHAFVVLIEEPRIERRFGAAYRRYKESVPRWLPRLSRREEDK